MDEKDKNVIVIESDDFVRKKVEDNLAKVGFRVIGVSSAADALAKAKDKFFDIVITEIETPDLNKYIEVIRKFKELNSETTVIVATAYDSIVAAVSALKEGAYDYIIKPFNFDELNLVIEKALEWRTLQLRCEEKLETEEKAFFDSSTAVYNQRYFQEAIKIETDRVMRYPSSVSFLFVDIDNFKEYSDAYGSDEAGKVLKEIAQLFWRYTRKTDCVSRYIGNQFVIIMPETKKEGGFFLASRLSTVIRETTFPDKKNLFGGRLSVSIGVISCPEDANSKEEVIQKAELALNQARKLGKDRIVLF